MAGGLGVPVPEQEAHQGAGDQQGPVGSVGMLQCEPSDRVGGVGVRRKMGGHGDFHSGGQDPPPRWGGPANGAGNSWDLGSMRGSRPEEPGEQGPRQDEQPVHGKDLAQVTVAEEKGGHGSLHGESPSFRFGPGAPAAVNSLETLRNARNKRAQTDSRGVREEGQALIRQSRSSPNSSAGPRRSRAVPRCGTPAVARGRRRRWG